MSRKQYHERKSRLRPRAAKAVQMLGPRGRYDERGHFASVALREAEAREMKSWSSANPAYRQRVARMSLARFLDKPRALTPNWVLDIFEITCDLIERAAREGWLHDRPSSEISTPPKPDDAYRSVVPPAIPPQVSSTVSLDEITALSACVQALGQLEPSERARVTRYLHDRYA